MRAFAMTGIETACWISSTLVGSAIPATPPSLRMSAGTRSRAITAHAPASSATLACSAVVTSMMTPPFSISARPDFTRKVPVSRSTGHPSSTTSDPSVPPGFSRPATQHEGPPYPERMPRPRRVTVLMGVSALLSAACGAGSSAVVTHTSRTPSSPAPVSATSRPPLSSPFDVYPPSHLGSAEQIASARRKITHVVFLVKENRTFDTYFGRYPGADGATTGKTCEGKTVPLVKAHDLTPGPDHSFSGGIHAIDGGKMYCFSQLYGGLNLQSYVQYTQSQIPNYWAYAKHFVLADHFFTGVYGPTGIEHVDTVAAQTGRFIDHERATPPGQFGTNGIPREFCGDPTERAYSFHAGMTQRQVANIGRLENEARPVAVYSRFAFLRRACMNIKILPDELTQAGVSWKYYLGQDDYVETPDWIRHWHAGP